MVETEKTNPSNNRKKSQLIVNDERYPLSCSKFFTEHDVIEFRTNGKLHNKLNEEHHLNSRVLEKSHYISG